MDNTGCHDSYNGECCLVNAVYWLIVVDRSLAEALSFKSRSQALRVCPVQWRHPMNHPTMIKETNQRTSVFQLLIVGIHSLLTLDIPRKHREDCRLQALKEAQEKEVPNWDFLHCLDTKRGLQSLGLWFSINQQIFYYMTRLNYRLPGMVMYSEMANIRPVGTRGLQVHFHDDHPIPIWWGLELLVSRRVPRIRPKAVPNNELKTLRQRSANKDTVGLIPATSVGAGKKQSQLHHSTMQSERSKR